MDQRLCAIAMRIRGAQRAGSAIAVVRGGAETAARTMRLACGAAGSRFRRSRCCAFPTSRGAAIRSSRGESRWRRRRRNGSGRRRTSPARPPTTRSGCAGGRRHRRSRRPARSSSTHGPGAAVSVERRIMPEDVIAAVSGSVRNRTGMVERPPESPSSTSTCGCHSVAGSALIGRHRRAGRPADDQPSTATASPSTARIDGRSKGRIAPTPFHHRS